MASSSSTTALHHRHHHQADGGAGDGAPAPPPPTPSNHQSLPTGADAALSRLLNQLLLTPTSLSLSLPPRRSRFPLSPPEPSPSPLPSPSPSAPPPLISLLDRQHELLFSAARELGFFHVTDHCIPPHLPSSAHLEAQSFPALVDAHEVFDVGSAHLDEAPALKEYVGHLERVGIEVVEMLSGAAGGFCENPFGSERGGARCLMRVCRSTAGVGDEEEQEDDTGGWGETTKCYPYVVCLQYGIGGWTIDGESGVLVAIAPRDNSVLVTLGDIAQVWSNGRFKKVRGVPRLTSQQSYDDCNCISISLLVTLPLNTVISPMPMLPSDGRSGGDDDVDLNKFQSFCLDEHGWRVYPECLSFKYPLMGKDNLE